MSSFLYGPMGKRSFIIFFSCLNNFHPNLKFTYEYSTEQINFLDVIVKKEKHEFVTIPPLYSCHPDHMKTSSIYSQGL